MAKPRLKVLIADDSANARNSIEKCLLAELQTALSLEIELVDSAEAAVSACQKTRPHIVVIDITFAEGGMNGLSATELIKKSSPETTVIVISNDDRAETQIRAVQEFGADGFVRRSGIKELCLICKQVTLARLHSQGLLVDDRYQILTASPAMRRSLQDADRLDAITPAMIVGETGTGKELVARRIHANAAFLLQKPDMPLVVVDPMTLNEKLFESEFFGHVRGAFTGATTDKIGYIERANGGTLFIDEIHNIPIPFQQKLLRVLNDGVFQPVGSAEDRISKFRLILATNQDPARCVAEGRLLHDFYSRLRVYEIGLPPLRERPEDIPLIIDKVRSERPDLDREFGREVVEFLQSQRWPHNIRELRSVVLSAMIRSRIPAVQVELVKEAIRSGDLSQSARGSKTELIAELAAQCLSGDVRLQDVVDDLEQRVIPEMERRVGSSRKIAEATGYSRSSIERRLDLT